MTFELNRDQRDFAHVLRGFFEKHCAHDHVGAVLDGGDAHDTALWTEMNRHLGLGGLAIDEHYGGSGAGLVELVIMLEEYGRGLAPTPLFATAGLARPLLAGVCEEAAQEWLPKLADGSTTATWAVLGSSGEVDLGGHDVTASRSGSVWVLNGCRQGVVDGATADAVLTVAATNDGPAVFLVQTPAPGVKTVIHELLDPSLPAATVQFEAAPATWLGRVGPGVRTAIAEATIALSALQLGCLNAVLDIAVEHAKTRTQFGRPIGSFQAIKHRCADMFVDAETTRWVVYYAAALADQEADEMADLAHIAHMTGAFATAATQRAAANLLQVLGGIGYTWEHPAHRYFKRSTATGQILGGRRQHLDAVAAVIGDGKQLTDGVF